MKFLTVVCFLVFAGISLPARSHAAPRAAALDCVDRMAHVEGNRASTMIDVVKLEPGNRMPGLPPGEPSRFIVSVVVDTVGRADSTTIQLPAGLDSVSVNAIRNVLPAWRFIPAHLGGCAVKQVVRLTFSRK